jgi:hypothetical protein
MSDREKNIIVLTGVTFGSVYLCAKSLKEINNTTYSYKELPFYCNYFIFGFSSVIFMGLVNNINYCSFKK